MFQDEARFGRLSRPRRSRAPPGKQNSYERGVTDVYGAVSPEEGEWAYRLCEKMNTAGMSAFLTPVGQRYPDDDILMAGAGASSPRALPY